MISCAKCGAQNPDNFTHCLECGAKLSAEPAENTSQLEKLGSQTPVPSVEIGRVECWKCQASIPGDSVFCPQCGAPQNPDTAEAGTGTAFMNQHTNEPTEDMPKVRLVVLEPTGREGLALNVMDGENLLGREEGSVLLQDECVSPLHCKLTWRDGALFCKDLDSLNGVYLKISGEVPIQDGALFRVGRQLLFYQHVSNFNQIEQSISDDGTKFAGSPAKNVWGKLIKVTANGGMGEHILLTKPQLSIGREVGDVTFPNDGFVSGSHARIAYTNNRASLADLGSSNGTYLKLNEETEIGDRELLLIGQKLLRVEYLNG